MKKVGIVICNYNKQDYVLNCIQSVLESKFTDYELYVVDNHSSDDSAKLIQERYKGMLHLIETTENLGGSGGFNTGLRAALKNEHPYLMCIDNDVLVDENAIGALSEFLDTNPETGMVGSKVYHMQRPEYVQQFGMKLDFENYCVEANYLNCIEDGTMPEVVYSDAVAACSLMVRRAVIEKIGIMPEEDFLYWDDTEWGYRCNLAGYKVASYGKSQVLHMMGAKKESINTFPTYYAWRNWIRFFIKYVSEEKLDKMSEIFIKSVFKIVYEGLYNKEYNKAKTVMAAYDDALHNVTGKATEDKIFVLDKNENKLKNLIKNKKRICIIAREHVDYAQELALRIQEMSSECQIEIGYKNDCDLCLNVCDYIFDIKDFSLKNVYIDVDDNILETEDDALMVINFMMSFQAFLMSQKPIFLRQAKELRKLTSK